MAQVENTRSAAVGKHNSRTSRKSLFIDLTPMVDLAFLLTVLDFQSYYIDANNCIAGKYVDGIKNAGKYR